MLRFLLPLVVCGLEHTFVPMPEYQFAWTADTNTTRLHVEIVITPSANQTFGWVGFGIAGGAGGMQGGDMFTAYPTGSSSCAIQDRRASATSKDLPKEDTSNSDGYADWILESCSLQGEVFTIAANRAFVTYDVYDLDFVTGPMTLLFAWGQSKPSSASSLSFHDGGNIPKEVSLWGEAVAVFDPAKFEADHDTHEIKIMNASIGPGTSFTCRGFNLTTKDNNRTDAIAFEALVDKINEPYVHHMVLYTCSSPPPSDLFECTSMPANCLGGIIWAWGKGGNPIVLPPITGMELGINGRTMVALQMHYNNPDDVKGLIDNSGARIYRTNQLRELRTGLFFIGSLMLDIPFGKTVVSSSGVCNDTGSWPAEGLTAYSSFLHAHTRGRRIWTNVVRNGTIIGTMGNNQAYDFNLQKVVALSPALNLLPGDQFVTYCVYDTSQDTKNVKYGEGTDSEMCINMVLYYPLFGTRPQLTCGVKGMSPGAVNPGPNSCVLLPNDPPSAYIVTGWTKIDDFFLTGGNASCAPGFFGEAVLGCTGLGAPYTFSGCTRTSRAPTNALTSVPTPVSAPTLVSNSSNTSVTLAPSAPLLIANSATLLATSLAAFTPLLLL